MNQLMKIRNYKDVLHAFVFFKIFIKFCIHERKRLKTFLSFKDKYIHATRKFTNLECQWKNKTYYSKITES